jgi:hypothetical protein
MRIDEPVVDSDDAPLPEGEVVAAPLPSGRAMSLRFASPYEPWIDLDGRRVIDDVDGDARTVLTWVARRLTALFRALDLHRGLRATLTPAGQVVVTDIVGVDDGVAIDHDALSATLEGARVKTLDFAALGVGGGRAELLARVRGLYAAGTLLELRVEDGRRVVARRRWRVGRG